MAVYWTFSEPNICREKELLEREEAHVDQLRQKDAHYSTLVAQLKERIVELEKKIEEMAAKLAFCCCFLSDFL